MDLKSIIGSSILPRSKRVRLIVLNNVHTHTTSQLLHLLLNPLEQFEIISSNFSNFMHKLFSTPLLDLLISDPFLQFRVAVLVDSLPKSNNFTESQFDGKNLDGNTQNHSEHADDIDLAARCEFVYATLHNRALQVINKRNEVFQQFEEIESESLRNLFAFTESVSPDATSEMYTRFTFQSVFLREYLSFQGNFILNPDSVNLYYYNWILSGYETAFRFLFTNQQNVSDIKTELDDRVFTMFPTTEGVNEIAFLYAMMHLYQGSNFHPNTTNLDLTDTNVFDLLQKVNKDLSGTHFQDTVRFGMNAIKDVKNISDLSDEVVLNRIRLGNFLISQQTHNLAELVTSLEKETFLDGIYHYEVGDSHTDSYQIYFEALGYHNPQIELSEFTKLAYKPHHSFDFELTTFYRWYELLGSRYYDNENIFGMSLEQHLYYMYCRSLFMKLFYELSTHEIDYSTEPDEVLYVMASETLHQHFLDAIANNKDIELSELFTRKDMDTYLSQWEGIAYIHRHGALPADIRSSSTDDFLVPCNEIFIFNTSAVFMLLNSVFGFDQSVINFMLSLKDIFLFLDVYFTSELIAIFLIVLIMVLFLYSLFNIKTVIITNKPLNLILSAVRFIEGIILENLKRDQLFVGSLLFALFFLILLGNVVGLIPFPTVITSQLLMALTLSLTAFVVNTQIGIIKNKGHFSGHLIPNGTPNAISPFVLSIESLSYSSRIVSLSVRLFANITAGHTLLKILSIFAILLMEKLSLPILLTIVLIPFLMAIMSLEVMIAFLQAYVFFILIVVYLQENQ